MKIAGFSFGINWGSYFGFGGGCGGPLLDGMRFGGWRGEKQRYGSHDHRVQRVSKAAAKTAENIVQCPGI
jgi:hypothetical protein